MAASEKAFEVFSGALETTHGTAIAAPTNIFNLTGMVTPVHTVSRRGQSDGTLAEFRRSVVTRSIAQWEASGDLDVNTLPFFLEMAVKGAGAITTPGGGTLTRQHAYPPTMTSDDLKSATLFWGDPNNQIFQAAYAMVDTLTISNDASSDGGAQMSIKGTALFPTEVAPPTEPAFVTGGLSAGQRMLLWMDTSSAIGTTAITGRMISVEHTLNTGVSYKYLAQGTTSPNLLGYTRHGRGKRHMETKITFELTDTTQYDLFTQATVTKTRVIHQCTPVIEASLYPQVLVDTYGPLSDLSWTDLAGTNRAVTFTIVSEYDTTLAADFRIVVNNALTTV